MKRLTKAIIADIKESRKRIVDAIKAFDDKSQPEYYLRDLLPKGKTFADFGHLSLPQLRKYLLERNQKVVDQRIKEQLAMLETSDDLQPIEVITINVEWKKNRTWGHNPTATAFVYGLGQLSSGSISGCGYDKESTAVAAVLNQIPQFLKIMYTIKDKNIKVNNRELFGYGSGSSLLPRFEGGVGVGCYPRIFEKMGYEFRNTGSGKTFDVFTISKITKKRK